MQSIPLRLNSVLTSNRHNTMNRQEIKKIIDKTWGQGKSDMQTILKEIGMNEYKFDKDEVIEIFNSHYGKRGMTVTPNNLSELIASIGKLTSPKSVIDICCGTGNILHYFKDQQELKGIDINFDIIQLARNINPNIEFIATDTLQYDFDNSKYDLVVGSLPFGGKTQDNKSVELELMKKGLSFLKKMAQPFSSFPKEYYLVNSVQQLNFASK